MQRLKYSKLIKFLSILIALLSVVLLAEHQTPGNTRALSCSDFEIIYLRDIYEPLGSDHFRAFEDTTTTFFAQNIAKSYSLSEFQYLETPERTPITQLTDSATFDVSHTLEYDEIIARSSTHLADTLTDFIATCPSTRVVLVGYSAGAQIIEESLLILDDTSLDHIFHVSLLGNPLGSLLDMDFDLPETLEPRIYRYCTTGDIYCSDSTDLRTHFTYISDNIIYTAAVNLGHHIEQTYEKVHRGAKNPAFTGLDTAVLLNLHSDMASSHSVWKNISDKIFKQNSSNSDQIGLYFYGDVVQNFGITNPACAIGEDCGEPQLEFKMRNPAYTLAYREKTSVLYGINQTLSDDWRPRATKNIIVITDHPYYEDDLCNRGTPTCFIHYEDVLGKIEEKGIAIRVISSKPELASVYADITSRTGGKFYTTDQLDQLLRDIAAHPGLNFTTTHYSATAGTPITFTLDTHTNTPLHNLYLDLDGDNHYETKLSNTYQGFDCAKEFTTTFTATSGTHTIQAYYIDADNRTSVVATSTLEVKPKIDRPTDTISGLSVMRTSIDSATLTIPDDADFESYLLLANNVLVGSFTGKSITLTDIDSSETNIFTVIPIKSGYKTPRATISLEKYIQKEPPFIPKAPNTGIISL